MAKILNFLKSKLFGVILILSGIIASLEKYFDIKINFDRFWPIILIIIGIIFLSKKEKKNDD